MDNGVLVGLFGTVISAGVSLIAIFQTSKNTRDQVTNKLDANQQVMQNEIDHIKDDIAIVRDDIKTHNHYAQLFNENIPVIKEQIKVQNHRIDDLENAIKQPITVYQAPLKKNNTHQ